MSDLVNITIEQTIEAVTVTASESGDEITIAVTESTDNVTIEVDEKYGIDGVTPVKGVDYFDGDDGREIELQKNETHIQWKYTDDSVWNNLVALADINGYTPIKGIDYDDGYTPRFNIDYFNGTDGKELELQKTATHIQWRLEGGEWVDIVALIDLKGNPGTTDFTELANKPTELADINNTEGSKLSGIEDGANNYTHPTNHEPSIITQDSDNRFVTDAEKSAWNAKQPAGAYLVASDISGKADTNLAIAMAIAL